MTGKVGQFLSVEAFDLEMLDLVGGFVVTHEYRDDEHLTSGIQCSQGVFHVGTAGLVGNLEGTRSIGLEEGLHDLAGLITARVVGVGKDRHFKVVREPGRKPLGISLGKIFRYRVEHIVSGVLCRGHGTTEKGGHCHKRADYVSVHLQNLEIDRTKILQKEYLATIYKQVMIRKDFCRFFIEEFL
jgi:hypothetical protein